MRKYASVLDKESDKMNEALKKWLLDGVSSQEFKVQPKPQAEISLRLPPNMAEVNHSIFYPGLLRFFYCYLFVLFIIYIRSFSPLQTVTIRYSTEWHLEEWNGILFSSNSIYSHVLTTSSKIEVLCL